jgi:hypothetical protein
MKTWRSDIGNSRFICIIQTCLRVLYCDISPCQPFFCKNFSGTTIPVVVDQDKRLIEVQALVSCTEWATVFIGQCPTGKSRLENGGA